ncbi:MAG: hypothetical protein LC793_21165 [Thermomicrobia bacterium]|nr:hypothetical protein [Thermomicrobia bacterium]
MTTQMHPTTLSHLVINLRKRFELSKYRIAKEAPHRMGKEMNHAIISKLEAGDGATAYDTVQRIIEGIDKASGEMPLSRGDRRSLYESAFADRITYEAAKFAIYYLFVLDGQEQPLHPALEGLRQEILRDFPHTGEDAPDQEPVISNPGRTGKRGPRRKHVNLASAIGFEAVREMAEMTAAHPLRMTLLTQVMPSVWQNWQKGEAILGRGALLESLVPRNSRHLADRQAAQRGPLDGQIVSLFPRPSSE